MIAQINRRYAAARPINILRRLLSYFLFEGRPLTTRGRWVNPILFALFYVEKKLPNFKQVNQPIFILGTGRNGSTALGMILSLHRKIGFLNEAKALWHSIIPEGDVLGNFSNADDARFIFTESDATKKRVLEARRLLGVYSLLSISRYPLDKCSEFIYRVSFLKRIFPNAKFILLLRNGHDVCSSIVKWSENYGKQKNDLAIDWWGVDGKKWKTIVNELVPREPDLMPLQNFLRYHTDQVDLAAIDWILTTREGLRLQAKYPDSIITIKYENLTQNPEREVHRICNFLGIKNEREMLEYAASQLRDKSAPSTVNLHPTLVDQFEKTLHAAGY